LAERIFDNISLLRDSEPTNSNEIVFIKGHSSNSDGGEGYFKWVPTLLKEDNNGTYIKVNTLVTGRWERAFNSGKINALFFGLRDGEYDNTDIVDISGQSTPCLVYNIEKDFLIKALELEIIETITGSNITDIDLRLYDNGVYLEKLMTSLNLSPRKVSNTSNSQTVNTSGFVYLFVNGGGTPTSGKVKLKLILEKKIIFH
jgi:hypothetical protein